MKYKVMKSTVKRKNLYAHHKNGDTLFVSREMCDDENEVNDDYALAEMLYELKEEISNENYRTDESERNCA